MILLIQLLAISLQVAVLVAVVENLMVVLVVVVVELSKVEVQEVLVVAAED